MLYLNESEVQSIINSKSTIDTIEIAYKDFARNIIQTFPRSSAKLTSEDNGYLILPAIHTDKNIFGFKFATSIPSNKSINLPTVFSQIFLYSSISGQLLSIIESNFLTAVKTGSSAAVASKYFAKNSSKSFALIGTGEQAKYQLLAIHELFPFEEIRIFDQDTKQVNTFAQWIKHRFSNSTKVVSFDSASAAISDADIISTCTTSTNPVFDGSFLKEGVHINAIGSFTPQMQEIDLLTCKRTSKIVTDVISDALSISGFLIQSLNKNIITKTSIYAELGDIVNGRKPGRENDYEITLFESVGFGALDIALAITVYETAKLKIS